MIAAGAGGFTKWLATHKYEAAIGGVGSVAAVALYVKSKGKTSSSSTSATSTTSGETTEMPVGATDGGNLLGFEQTVTSLIRSLNAAKGAPTTPTAAPAPAAPATSSAGTATTGDAVHGATGSTFAGLTTGAAAGAYERSGGVPYFEPAPGVFEADTPTSDLAPGTHLFAKS